MTGVFYKPKITHLFWIIVITVTCISLWKYVFQQNIFTPSDWLLESKNDNRIPSIVHFIVGQSDRKAIQHRYALVSPFSFVNYLIFLAARRHIRPKKILVHYYEEPNTFWWNQTKQDSEIDISLVKSRLVENIFNKSVDHHSHRSDIIRLEVLMKYGGIYLDTDVLALRSFDPLLNLSDVVMAHQDDQQSTACSAVIIGKRNAIFLKRWYDAYQSFNQDCWDCHAVKISGELAMIYSKEVMVLPTNTFFRPSWNERDSFFKSNNYNFTPNYASHLWNKMYNSHLNELTPDKILKGNFTLARMLLHAISKETIQELNKFFIKISTD